MGKIGIVFDFFNFLSQNKKWWLIPMAVVLLLLGAIVFAVQSSAVAPFIYTLF
jgi:drug/metabolite transporter superfamily protein YnfA